MPSRSPGDRYLIYALIPCRLPCLALARLPRTSCGRLVGHINHTLFWKNLVPSAAVNNGAGGVLKDSPLKQAVDAAFGSLYAFVVGRSGWDPIARWWRDDDTAADLRVGPSLHTHVPDGSVFWAG